MMLSGPRARSAEWRCTHNLHWPIKWSWSAYPGSWDPPEPPQAGFACDWCGHARDPYRAWWWALRYRVLYSWRDAYPWDARS